MCCLQAEYKFKCSTISPAITLIHFRDLPPLLTMNQIQAQLDNENVLLKAIFRAIYVIESFSSQLSRKVFV